MSRLIFDELSDLLEREMQRQPAAQIAKLFNRERKFIYSMRDGCGFHCDLDFICGLRALGYDLVVQKTADDTPIQPEVGIPPRTRAIREILSLVKEDMLSSRDIISMRTTFESATDELCRITKLFETILPTIRSTEEDSISADVMALLSRRLLALREDMAGACFNAAVWSAAETAQKRISTFEHQLPKHIKASL